jgi:integrase
MSVLQGLVVNQPTNLVINGAGREGLLGQLWGAAREQWLAKLRHRNTRGNTATVYDVAHRQFFEFVGGPPWDVGSAIAQAWANELAEDGLAKASINQKLAALRSFFNHVAFVFRVPPQPNAHWLVSEGLLHRDEGELTLWPPTRTNPFDPHRIERHKVRAFSNVEIITVTEFEAMLRGVNFNSIVGQRDFALLYTYFHTARRAAEILGLRWGDIEPHEGGHFLFRYVYKGGEIKQQIMDRTVYFAIVAYLKAAGRYDSISDEDYIFTALNPDIGRLGYAGEGYDPEGRPISAVQANNVLKKYARRAGVAARKAHLHALRHGGARHRWLIMKSTGTIDYGELKDLLGHASLAVTEGYVRDVLETPEDRTGEAAAKILLKNVHRRRAAWGLSALNPEVQNASNSL